MIDFNFFIPFSPYLYVLRDEVFPGGGKAWLIPTENKMLVPISTIQKGRASLKYALQGEIIHGRLEACRKVATIGDAAKDW
jgi:hypothetical protein